MSMLEFTYKLTPRAERILAAASEEATRRGHEYVGAEHLFWALMADPDSLPTQIAEKAGVRSTLVQQVEDAIANSIATDFVVDREGNVIGHMTAGPDGEGRIVDDEGKEVPAEVLAALAAQPPATYPRKFRYPDAK